MQRKGVMGEIMGGLREQLTETGDDGAKAQVRPVWQKGWIQVAPWWDTKAHGPRPRGYKAGDAGWKVFATVDPDSHVTFNATTAQWWKIDTTRTLEYGRM